MSVETDFDLEAMTEIWNSWGEMFRQKDLELQKLKKNLPKDNSAGWYGGCEVDFKNLLEENEKLKEENYELQGKKDYWEGEHSDLWLGVFGVLNDAGYGPTSTGQLISFINDIIAENEQLKKPKPKKTITCSSCGQTGHNKISKKCPNIIDA